MNADHPRTKKTGRVSSADNQAASEGLVQEVFVRVLKYRAGHLGESRFNELQGGNVS